MDYLSNTVKLLSANNSQSSATEKLAYSKPKLDILKVENIVTSGIQTIGESGCGGFAS